MSLILAVDRDKRQVNQLVSLVHKHVAAELLHAASAAEGIEALAGRIPDLILTSSLLSPKDDGVLARYLRELGPPASHVQTLAIPVLKSSRPRRSKSGVLSKLRRESEANPAGPDGCDPEVFAEEINLYLARAAEERDMKAAHRPAQKTVVAAEAPSADSFEGVEQFEADQYPPIDNAFSQPDAVADIDEAPLPSLDVVYAETIRAAEAFGEVTAESEAEAEPSTLSAEVLKEYPAYSEFVQPVIEARAVKYVAEQVDETPLVLDEPAVERMELLAKPDEGAQPEQDARTTELVEEDLAAIPLDRLVALFADLEPRSIEVMEPSSDALANDGSIDEGPAIIEEIRLDDDGSKESAFAQSASVDLAVASGGGGQDPPYEAPAIAASESAVIDPPQTPVLDEEELVLLGEAAWKATFREGLLKDLGLTPDRKKQKGTSPAVARRETDSASKPAASAGERKADESAAASGHDARKDKSKKKNGRAKNGKTPAQDEWGLFDPDQCGFSALVEKLDKVTEEPETRQRRAGSRTRVISY